MIQADGIKRQVFIKLVNNESMQKILKDTNGEAKYKHHNGEVTTVGITVAGLGTKRIRVANLPPEVPDAALRTLLAPFGKVQIIQQEMWTKMYRYPVLNGNKARNHNVDKTHRVPFDVSGKQDPIII
jgi:hypothetical protein